MIIFQKGQKFYDREGKLFATAARNIHSGEYAIPDQFIWVGEPPKIGELIPAALERYTIPAEPLRTTE